VSGIQFDHGAPPHQVGEFLLLLIILGVGAFAFCYYIFFEDLGACYMGVLGTWIITCFQIL
jgi:hypothetical protein